MIWIQVLWKEPVILFFIYWIRKPQDYRQKGKVKEKIWQGVEVRAGSTGSHQSAPSTRFPLPITNFWFFLRSFNSGPFPLIPIYPVQILLPGRVSLIWRLTLSKIQRTLAASPQTQLPFFSASTCFRKLSQYTRENTRSVVDWLLWSSYGAIDLFSR